MNVLTVGALRKAIVGLPKDTIVIIGNDDELNGVHNAWYAQTEQVDNLKIRTIGNLEMFEGEIFEQFEVHLGHTKEKLNVKKVLVIS